jgi:hypothetical protein
MTGVTLNPVNGAAGANILQSDNNLNQQTGLDALLNEPSFTFEGANGLGGVPAEADIRNPGIDVNGGAPWLLGQVWYIPDSMENKFFGRTILGDGTAYSVKNGIYSFYDKNGDFIGNYKETTAEKKTMTLEFKKTGSGVNASIGDVGYKGSTSETTKTIYLAPVK